MSPEKHNSHKIQVNNTLSESYLKKISSSSFETNALNVNKKILYDLISAVFSDSRRRFNLSLLRDGDLKVREWTQKLELRKPEVEVLLQLLQRNSEKSENRALVKRKSKVSRR